LYLMIVRYYSRVRRSVIYPSNR